MKVLNSKVRPGKQAEGPQAGASFSHLHVHSEYSFYRSTCRIHELVERAANFNIEAIAVADYCNLHGAVKFFRAAKAVGVKPIIGCQLVLEEGSEKIKHSPELLHRIVLLAKNEEGYRNLVQLVSGSRNVPCAAERSISSAMIQKHRGSLIALSGGLNSGIAHLCRKGLFHQAEAILRDHVRLFGAQNLYIELQRHGAGRQKLINEFLFHTACKLGLRCVATNSTHYVLKEHATSYGMLAKLGWRCTGVGSFLHSVRGQLHLRSAEEMHRLFQDVPETLANASAIARQCSFEFTFGSRRTPKVEGRDRIAHYRRLESLIRKGLSEKFPLIPGNKRSRESRKAAGRRAMTEFRLAKRRGLLEPFLICSRVASYLKTTGGCSAAKEAGGGSLINYLLGVSPVDPIKSFLQCEPFLNPTDGKWPCVRLEIPLGRLEGVLSELRSRYSSESVAWVGSYYRLREKYLVEALASDFGIGRKTAWQIRSKITEGALPAEVEGTFRSSSDRKRGRIRSLLTTVRCLENLPYETSRLAATFVVGSSFSHELPLRHSDDLEPVTQYAFDDLEILGHFKLSLLRMRCLTLLAESECRWGTGKPAFAADALEKLRTGNISGFQEFDSPRLRKLLMAVQPKNFQALVMTVALWASSPNRAAEFLKRTKPNRRSGQISSSITPILSATGGFYLYKEQVQAVWQTLTRCSIPEAVHATDILANRRAGEAEKMFEMFLSAIRVSRQISESQATEVFADLRQAAIHCVHKAQAAWQAHVLLSLARMKAKDERGFTEAIHRVSERESENTATVRFLLVHDEGRYSIRAATFGPDGTLDHVDGGPVKLEASGVHHLKALHETVGSAFSKPTIEWSQVPKHCRNIWLDVGGKKVPLEGLRIKELPYEVAQLRRIRGLL